MIDHPFLAPSGQYVYLFPSTKQANLVVHLLRLSNWRKTTFHCLKLPVLRGDCKDSCFFCCLEFLLPEKLGK